MSDHRKKIPAAVRFYVLSRDGNACQYCGARPPQVQLVIDHIVPVVKGGTNHPGNLRAACQPCNASKHANMTADDDIGRLRDRVAARFHVDPSIAADMALQVLKVVKEEAGGWGSNDAVAELARFTLRGLLRNGVADGRPPGVGGADTLIADAVWTMRLVQIHLRAALKAGMSARDWLSNFSEMDLDLQPIQGLA